MNTVAVRDSGQAVRAERAELFRRWASAAPWLAFSPPLLLPMLDTTTMVAISVAAAVFGAVTHQAATRLRAPLPKGATFEPRPLPDATPSEEIYLGMGMPFDAYRSALDQMEAEQGTLSDDARRRFMETQVHERMEPLALLDKFATGHGSFMGMTGVGKTEFIKSLLAQQIRRGGGGCLFDAKGELEALLYSYSVARSCGRENDILFFSLNYPRLSHTYNPLLGGEVREAVSQLMKMQNPKGEEFFLRMSRVGLTAAMICLRAQRDPRPFSFPDLAQIFSSPNSFLEMYASMDPARAADREFVATFLRQWITVDGKGEPYLKEQKFTDIFAGLMSVMMDFSHSEWRELCDVYDPEIRLLDAIRQNKIVIISIPALADSESARVFGKLFLADLARAMGQIQATGTQPMLPWYVFLDEYKAYADESHDGLWQLGRSARVSIWPGVQGKGFLDYIGPQFSENVLGNCHHQLYMALNDPNSRQWAADSSRTVLRRMQQNSTSLSSGYGHKNVETGNARNETYGTSTSTGFKEARETLLQPDDFMMGPGEAILITPRGTFRLQLPMVIIDDMVTSIDEVKLPRRERREVAGLNLMPRYLAANDAMIRKVSGVK